MSTLDTLTDEDLSKYTIKVMRWPHLKIITSFENHFLRLEEW